MSDRIEEIRKRYKRLPRSSDIDFLLSEIDRLQKELANIEAELIDLLNGESV